MDGPHLGAHVQLRHPVLTARVHLDGVERRTPEPQGFCPARGLDLASLQGTLEPDLGGDLLDPNQLGERRRTGYRHLRLEAARLKPGEQSLERRLVFPGRQHGGQ
jgi:hypothetical protein